MRWLYADPSRPEERRYIEDTSRRIDAWWRSFAERTHDLDSLFSGKAEWDLPAWMEKHLQAIHPSLMWEYGPAVRSKGHRLVITPETQHWLRPLVSTIVERAPRIEGWEQYTHRLAEPLEQALATVGSRAGVDIADARVEIAAADHHRLALHYTFAACRDADDRDALHAAFIATESLLGEDILDQWIGPIEVAPRKRSLLRLVGEADEGLTLQDLRREVSSRIDTVRAALPEAPCIDRDDEWTLWELKPEPGDDYPEQSDLFVGKSMVPPVWRALRGNGPFFSDSFSRHGETFCYLKIDGSEGLDEEHFADKAEIEDAIDDALRTARAGCFIGGGTGLRYSYLDFALLDVDRAIDIVREVLQRGNIAKRSWLLFHDANLAAEWVGIWPDTPEPPLSME
jgi:hypothetical protein